MVKTELVISYIFNFTRWFEDNDFIFRDHNNFSAANSCNIVVSTEGLISISMYSTSYCPYQSNDPYVHMSNSDIHIIVPQALSCTSFSFPEPVINSTVWSLSFLLLLSYSLVQVQVQFISHYLAYILH